MSCKHGSPCGHPNSASLEPMICDSHAVQIAEGRKKPIQVSRLCARCVMRIMKAVRLLVIIRGYLGGLGTPYVLWCSLARHLRVEHDAPKHPCSFIRHIV